MNNSITDYFTLSISQIYDITVRESVQLRPPYLMSEYSFILETTQSQFLEQISCKFFTCSKLLSANSCHFP